MSRSRMNVFLDRDHARRVDELAVRKGVSRSGIVGAALASYLSPESGEHREAALMRRLDRLGRIQERFERDQTILIETVALFIRHQLSVTAPIPEAHLAAAKAQGRARFEQFIEQLALHLQRGRRVREVLDERIGGDGEVDEGPAGD